MRECVNALGGFYIFVFVFASFQDAGILLLIITALRNIRCCSLSVTTPFIACTVLFISHPVGVIYRSPLYIFSRLLYFFEGYVWRNRQSDTDRYALQCNSSGLGFAKQRGNGGSLVLLPMVIMSSLVGWHYFIEPAFNSLSRKEKT